MAGAKGLELGSVWDTSAPCIRCCCLLLGKRTRCPWTHDVTRHFHVVGCLCHLLLSLEASVVGVVRCRLQKHKLSLADIPAFDMAREFMLLSDEYSQKVRRGQGGRVA